MNIDDLTVGQIKEIKSMFGSESENKKSILSSAIGEYVIVRSRNEGINAGYLEDADETGCKISKAIRIWHHKPKDKTTSWYEGVSISGLHSSSKVSVAVKEKYIIESYSITVCEEVSRISIQEHKPNDS